MEIKFVSKWNSYFAVSDSEGEILIYDSFHPEVEIFNKYINFHIKL